MIQFGSLTYRGSRDYEASLRFIEYYKNKKILDEVGVNLLRKAIDVSEGVSKSILIACRLYFWNQIDLNLLKELLSGRLTETSYGHFSNFDRQELLDCLGPSILSNFAGENIDFSSLNTNFDYRYSSRKFKLDVSYPEDVVYYLPPPTGFFSVIENIIIGKFVCALNGKKFYLTAEPNWWRYPVSFREIFDANEIFERVPSKRDSLLTWQVAREIVGSLGKEAIRAFKEFKVSEYLLVKRRLADYASQRLDLYSVFPEDGVLFIRGGDKLKSETIETPLNLLARDVERLRSNNVALFLLSDDYTLAKDLLTFFHLPDNSNLTPTDRGGYFNDAIHSVSDVHNIIRNFLLIANCRYSLSCPSSNIVNSAHWANRILDTDFRPSSIPSYRYVFL